MYIYLYQNDAGSGIPNTAYADDISGRQRLYWRIMDDYANNRVDFRTSIHEIRRMIEDKDPVRLNHALINGRIRKLRLVSCQKLGA